MIEVFFSYKHHYVALYAKLPELLWRRLLKKRYTQGSPFVLFSTFMTSFRRVAFPLGITAILGGALLFSLSTARGQTAATPMAPPPPPGGSSSSTISGNTAVGDSSTGVVSAAAPATTGGAPTLPSTIGVSPVFPARRSTNTVFTVQGGTGNSSYDLQIENLYSLLRERGVPIPNVLHPLSTAKPSFIVEKLITLVLTGTGAPAQGGGTSGQSSQPASISTAGATSEGLGAAAVDEGAYNVAITVRSIERIINAEISRGTGRLGGAHRTKLVYLSRAVNQIAKETEAAIKAKQKAAQAESAKWEAAENQAKSNIAGRFADSAVTREGEQVGRRLESGFQQEANQKQGEANQAETAAALSAVDKTRLEAQARLYARAADKFTPNIP